MAMTRKLRGDIALRRQATGTVEAGLIVRKGDRVQVEHEGVWYDCDVLAADGGTITARFDDGGDEEEDIDVAMRVRPMPPPMSLTKGQQVEVFYEGVWYASEVLEVSEDGTTCTAKYEDGGDEEPDIDVRSRVRPSRILLSALEVGSKHKGTVVSIAPFGAFVDIAAERDGLVHISRISQERVEDVGEILSVGQEIDVWVSQVDGDRLGLSMLESRFGGPGSREPVDVKPFQNYSPDQWIDATVLRFAPYGVFASVKSPDGSSEATGMIHISQIRDGFVHNAADEVEVGQEVKVRVLRVTDGKISLSMKDGKVRVQDGGSMGGGPAREDNLEAFANIPEGTWLKGKVARIVSFGLFVTVSTPDGSAEADGLVHVSQIRDGFVQSAEDEAEVGQEVDVWIKNVDVDGGKMSLSMRREEE